ncbi:type II secretion system protein [Niallia endozanthoxylica]|uniref:type II secretion system protein n=1 Tax=Niallia endozanthoxylica TaxID=2036016 RepID=UPI00168B0292|nr:type II secretion system protein [Niallia endozanthoxylica]
MNDKSRYSENGLTLVEVLVSITILAIILTSFLSFFNQAYSYTKKNEDKTVGINVAKNVLYYFEQQDYETFSNYISKNSEASTMTYNSCADPTLNFSSEEVKVCHGFFSTTINNTPFETTVTLQKHESLSDYLIPVKVTVTWNENKQTATVEGVIKK